MEGSPGEFFSNHPKLYSISMLCAAEAGIVSRLAQTAVLAEDESVG